MTHRQNVNDVALLGVSGYIGSQFAKELNERSVSWFAVPRNIYTDAVLFRRLLGVRKPAVVINCAAYIPPKGVDFCEDDKSKTIEANLLLPAMLANVCADTDTVLLHLSSGCYYNGDNGGKGWSEKDVPQLSFNTKCGVYVGSKQLAEEMVSRHKKSYICRIRLPFDRFDHPRNLISKLMGFVVVCDETQSLSHRGDAVKACLDLWQLKSTFGTYNCTNPGAVNYRELCHKINTVLKRDGSRMRFIETWQFDQTLARTPKSRCVLDCSKLLETGAKMRPVDEAIDESLENWSKS